MTDDVRSSPSFAIPERRLHLFWASIEAIAALKSHPVLEVDVVESSDGVTWASDTMNPTPPEGST